jgi:hypothetical protein
MKGDGMIVAFLMLVFGFTLVGLILEDYERFSCKEKALESKRELFEIDRICK